MSQYIVSVESSSLIHDLFVSCVDSLVGKESFMWTKCFIPMQKQRARVWIHFN